MISFSHSANFFVVVVVVAVVLSSTFLIDSAHSWSSSSSVLSRRDVFSVVSSSAAMVVTAATTGVVVWTGAPQPAVAVDDSNTMPLLSLLRDELILSKSKLKDIPDLLQAQEWEKVRTILKTPPVNKLWNLGDSQNTVLKLVKEINNVELFELKDELAYNLQMCDQLTYDNVFVYFQPGSGKIKIKEPTDSANKAIDYLEQIIAAAAK